MPTQVGNRADASRLKEALDRLEMLVGIRDQVDAVLRGQEKPAPGSTHPGMPDRPNARVRRKIRDLYFSVEDISLRRELIATHRAVERNARKASVEYAEALKAEVVVSRRNIADPPWAAAALLSAACFAAGAAFGGWEGTIGGAVGGAIVWQALISVGRRCAGAALAKVEALQREAAESDAQLAVWLNYFSRNEELTGERDPKFD